MTGEWFRLAGELLQALRSSASNCLEPSPASYELQNETCQVDNLMMRALTAVFGMGNNGKIKKEKARQVVEKLGLVYGQEEEEVKSSDEMAVEEVLSGIEQVPDRQKQELLHEAFKIFDEDGNGYIDAAELKRVLQCLGLDKGWDISDIEKMLMVVDLNLDGKIDFSEFELMMMS